MISVIFTEIERVSGENSLLMDANTSETNFNAHGNKFVCQDSIPVGDGDEGAASSLVTIFNKQSVAAGATSAPFTSGAPTISLGEPVVVTSSSLSVEAAGTHSNLALNEIVVQTVSSQNNNNIDMMATTEVVVLSTAETPSALTSTKVVATNAANSSFSRQESVDSERSCWICFASDEDGNMAPWVQPCKCRGSTKWVHQSCLYRWVDEKQKGNALRAVSCQQCQTEYILVFPRMGKVAGLLETVDNLIKRVSPFLAAGVFVGSLYWTAVTYGAVTFLQVYFKKYVLFVIFLFNFKQ